MWHDFAAQRQNRLNVKAKDFLQLQLQPQAQAGREWWWLSPNPMTGWQAGSLDVQMLTWTKHVFRSARTSMSTFDSRPSRNKILNQCKSTEKLQNYSRPRPNHPDHLDHLPHQKGHIRVATGRQMLDDALVGKLTNWETVKPTASEADNSLHRSPPAPVKRKPVVSTFRCKQRMKQYGRESKRWHCRQPGGGSPLASNRQPVQTSSRKPFQPRQPEAKVTTAPRAGPTLSLFDRYHHVCHIMVGEIVKKISYGQADPYKGWHQPLPNGQKGQKWVKSFKNGQNSHNSYGQAGRPQGDPWWPLTMVIIMDPIMVSSPSTPSLN